MNLVGLIYSVITTFFVGLIIHRWGIAVAGKLGLMDMPTMRRRHQHPTPVIGGLCILTALSIGLGVYLLFHPSFWAENRASILALGASLLILSGVGLVDDVRGLGPAPKIIFQLIAATVCMVFEPHVHQFGVNWRSILGPVVWPMGAIWLVGITNAINLIDGLDGLAGGSSLLICSSILVLSMTHAVDSFSTVIIALLIPATLSFMTVNWSPAKMFLGDNGSLTLGFIIASASLMCSQKFDVRTSWITPCTVLLMTGYPILDMGLAVRRRYMKGLPLFKADRNHLHYRIQRLGLSVRQTALLLLSISFYLQIAALFLNFVAPEVALIGISLSFFSIFSLLYVIRVIEKHRVQTLSAPLVSLSPNRVDRNPLVLNIELSPLFEVGLFEEKDRYASLVSSLEAVVRTMIRSKDEVFRSHDCLTVVISDFIEDTETCQELQERFSKKLQAFSELVDLQTSLSSLPITVSRQMPIQSLSAPIGTA